MRACKLLQFLIVATLSVSSAWTSPDALGATQKPLQPITIAQFGHVFLYLPVYVAVDKGFFKEQGLDVHLVSTGGDEKTFAAVVSNNAQFGIADPVFAAIARERGRGGKVVASVVSGVPEWIVSFRPDIKPFDKATGFAGYKIATYSSPSTSYSVMKEVLSNNGHPVDGKIVQGAFGSLLALMKAKQADMALEIEPVVSIALQEGAHIVYSPGKQFPQFAMTGMTVSDDYCKTHPKETQASVTALSKAMNYIHSDFNGALEVSKKEFPEVKEAVLRDALKRLIQEGTIPKSPVLDRKAWERAVGMRKSLGDIKGAGSFDETVDMSFANQVPH